MYLFSLSSSTYFLFDSYELHVDLYYESWSSGHLCDQLWLAFSLASHSCSHPICKARPLILDIMPDFFNRILCHTCDAYKHCWLLPFYTIFTDLNQGSQGKHKAKPVGFIFPHTFHMIKMRYDLAMTQFKLNILRQLLTEIYGIKGNNCCFTDCIKQKTKKLRWHAFENYEPMWFKLGLEIDTTELYILILVYVTLILIQGHRNARK